jgi:hypothetical protein
MAPITTTEQPVNYHEVEKHIKDLEDIKTEEELEEKLDSINKIGFSMSNWMKYLFNRDVKEEFNPVWRTVSNLELLGFYYSNRSIPDRGHRSTGLIALIDRQIPNANRCQLSLE